MKSIISPAPVRSGLMRVLFSLAIAVLWTACMDDAADLSARKDNASGKATPTESKSGSSKSQSSFGDYNISLSVNGLTWTYYISKNAGAKGLSHFIINLQNCGSSSSTIENVVWATVNGEPAVLENSEGKTGCNVSDVTTNFLKFDDLKDASSYTIVFQLDKAYGNFVGTTAWLKAGTSCFAYPIHAPCCPI